MIRKVLQFTAILALSSFMLWAFSARQVHSAVFLPPTESAGAHVLTTVIVYSQPINANGGLLLSSLRDPNGSDTDQWAWDGFKFGWHQAITEIQWHGAYDPARLGSGGPVVDFVVDIYPSIASGFQPDIGRGPLVHYEVGGNAGETPAAVVAGVQTYDYAFVLPVPFQAVAGTKYWVQIEAYQSGPPDWGLAAGSNGDGAYFRRIPGQGENYQLVAGDAAFTLLGPGLNTHKTHLPIILRAGGG